MSKDCGSIGVPCEALIEFLKVEAGALKGSWKGRIVHPSSLYGSHQVPVLSYCDKQGPGASEAIAASDAKLVIARRSVIDRLEKAPSNRLLVGSNCPRLDFARVVDAFWPEPGDSEQATGPSVIHESACVADNVQISAGVMIGPGCTVGSGCVLHSGVKLYRGTKLGCGVRIDSNSVIGSPGFGFVRGPSGLWKRFPQRAGVIIEEDVEIGAGACIDRGALSDTVIGRGTKIDNLVYIAHNVLVGQNCLIMASAIVAGSCELEDDVVISPGANIRNGMRVGRGAHVGMGAVVVMDVAPRTVVMGVPAKMVREGGYED